jgi:hypothetical protein
VAAAFTSLNPVCQIDGHTLITGDEHFVLENLVEDFTITMKDTVNTLGTYSYKIEAHAEGGATSEVTGDMVINDANPAPKTTPDNTETTTDGISLEVWGMGDPTAPVTDSYDGDGISYVSGIKSCKADSAGTTIVGLQFTLTSTISGKSTARALEGYEGVCDDAQSVSLSGADCFQMLNMVTDSDGNTAAIGYKRSGSDDVEYIGYGDFNQYDGVNTVDFGGDGCLTGYRLAFESSSRRRVLNTGPAELKGMSAVSNPSLQDSVASTANLLSDASAGT